MKKQTIESEEFEILGRPRRARQRVLIPLKRLRLKTRRLALPPKSAAPLGAFVRLRAVALSGLPVSLPPRRASRSAPLPASETPKRAASFGLRAAIRHRRPWRAWRLAAKDHERNCFECETSRNALAPVTLRGASLGAEIQLLMASGVGQAHRVAASWQPRRVVAGDDCPHIPRPTSTP